MNITEQGIVFEINLDAAAKGFEAREGLKERADHKAVGAVDRQSGSGKPDLKGYQSDKGTILNIVA